jgi:hypothetical protein
MMFKKLREHLHNATNPFQGFLGELWTVWGHDVARAVLLARRSWQSLPDDLVQQAADMEAAAQAAQGQREINDAVNLQLGLLGISPGAGGSFGVGLGTNPDHALFISVMGSIRAHRGNPPAQPQMVILAPAVLGGQIDPVQALVRCAPAFTRPQLAMAVQAMQMMGMSQFVSVIALVQAATALPRDQIARLLPPEPGVSAR